MADPLKQFRYGNLSAAVFKNAVARDGEPPSVFHTVVVSRGYKDADGTWRNSNSFAARDLPIVSELLALAYRHVLILDGADIVSDDLREAIGGKKTARPRRNGRPDADSADGNGDGEATTANPVNPGVGK